jgi:hypothetical protein
VQVWQIVLSQGPRLFFESVFQLTALYLEHLKQFSHPCQYGDKCYRKGLDHFARYYHPWDTEHTEGPNQVIVFANGIDDPLSHWLKKIENSQGESPEHDVSEEEKVLKDSDSEEVIGLPPIALYADTPP